jgi:hypothetical protein
MAVSTDDATSRVERELQGFLKFLLVEHLLARNLQPLTNNISQEGTP